MTRKTTLSDEKSQLPVKLSYRFDQFLMYLIQDVTKRPTIEIDKLQEDIAELDAEVKRLDDALADTYVSQLDPNAKRETD